MTTITIVDRIRTDKLAEAVVDQGVFKFEGNYYFAPDKVEMKNLVVTERLYSCPYKGLANWIDLQTADGVVKDVAWVYHNPKPGYTEIRGRIGFYDGTRPGTAAIKSETAQAATS
jgi:uncharacterized protein (DUF427 family)